MTNNLAERNESVETLWRQLLNAEIERAAHKSRKALTMFQEALGHRTTFEQLSQARQKWALAHAGTAATEVFEPYHEETNVFLDDGEKLLWQALGLDLDKVKAHALSENKKLPKDQVLSEDKAVLHAKRTALKNWKNDKTDSGYDLAWAWAKLGENYRLQGNLPWIHVTCSGGKLEVAGRDNKAIYSLGIRCFDSALKLREDYGWAKAHRGALIINARRCQPDGHDAQVGLDCLLEAETLQSDANPWTQAYIGCAHFALGLEELRRPQSAGPDGKMCKPKNGTYDFPSELLLCITHILLGWDRAPHLLKHAVQPGAVNLDRPFAMLYDLLEILPFVPPGDPTVGLILKYAQALASDDVVNPQGGVERDCSAAVRLEHFKLFIRYLMEERESPELRKQANTLLESVANFKKQLEKQGKPDPKRDRGILNNIVTVELTLLKVAAMFNWTNTCEVNINPVTADALEALIYFNNIVGIVSSPADLRLACEAIANQTIDDHSILSPVSTLRYDYAKDPKKRGTLIDGLANRVSFGRAY